MELDSAWVLAEGWAGVEALLGGAAVIDAAAVTTRAIVRRREIRQGSQLLRLALHYASGGSLRTTSAWGGLALDVALSDVGLLERLRRAETGDFLETLTSRLLDGAAQTEPGAAWDGAWDGPPIRIVDGSEFSGPGKGTARLRLHASYDPVARRFETLELTGKDRGESLARCPVEPGTVVVADRNYAKAPQLRELTGRGGFFLMRANLHALRALDPATGERLTSRQLLSALGDNDNAEIDAVLVDAKPPKGCKPEPLKVRLVVLRATQAQAARERRRIERSRSKHGVKPKPQTLEMAEVVLLVTNLDAQAWRPARLIPLYRLRWQIELAFKTLKSNFRMRQPPTRDPQLCRTWLLANLAAALLADRLADALEGALPPSAAGPQPTPG